MIALLLMGGCRDTVKNYYLTRSQAEADQLFERGWLPSIIPISARDITTSNDLDLNVSEGEFLYAPKDTNEFLRHLKPYSSRKLPVICWESSIARQKEKRYDALEYTAAKSVWIFLVNTQIGHVRYVMWLLR